MMAWIGLAQWVPVFEFDARATCIPRLVGTHVTDNGDGDGIADTNETLRIGITVQSQCSGGALRNCMAWLSTESPAIDCMRNVELVVGHLPGFGGVVTPEEKSRSRSGASIATIWV